MIVPVMAISNLVLTQQIYSEEKNAHAHYREPVALGRFRPDILFLYLIKNKLFLNDQEYYKQVTT